MTTLLNLFYTVPIVLSIFSAIVTLIVLLLPWNKILWAILWTLFVMTMFTWFHCTEGWKILRSWFKKPQPWYGDFDDLFI